MLSKLVDFLDDLDRRIAYRSADDNWFDVFCLYTAWFAIQTILTFFFIVTCIAISVGLSAAVIKTPFHVVAVSLILLLVCVVRGLYICRRK